MASSVFETTGEDSEGMSARVVDLQVRKSQYGVEREEKEETNIRQNWSMGGHEVGGAKNEGVELRVQPNPVDNVARTDVRLLTVGTERKRERERERVKKRSAPAVDVQTMQTGLRSQVPGQLNNLSGEVFEDSRTVDCTERRSRRLEEVRRSAFGGASSEAEEKMTHPS